MSTPDPSPLTRRITYVLTHAREAFTRQEKNLRKWDTLPNGGEIHIQFITPHTLRLALARLGPTPAGHALKMLNTELETLIKHWPEPDILETSATTRKLIPTDATGRYWLITTLTNPNCSNPPPIRQIRKNSCQKRTLPP